MTAFEFSACSAREFEFNNVRLHKIALDTGTCIELQSVQA